MQNTKEITLKKNEFAKLIGACKLRVTEGKIEILQKELIQGDEILIPAHKSFPVMALMKTKLSIRCGSTECFKQLKENPIPKAWTEIKEKLTQEIKVKAEKRDLKNKPYTMLILGESIGKTTQTIFQTNSLIQDGKKVAIIDADLGQQTINVPSTISKALVRESIFYINQLSPDRTRFVGHIKGTNRIAFIQNYRILELLQDTLSEDVVIVDTDSWITDIGLDYKCQLIELAKPDFCILIGADKIRSLKALENACETHNVQYHLILQSNRHYYERDRIKRKEHREMQYYQYFQDAEDKNYSLQDVTLFLEQPDKKRQSIQWIKYSPHLFKIRPRTLLGAYDKRRRHLGICIFRRIHDHRIFVTQKKFKGHVRYLVVGEAMVE